MKLVGLVTTAVLSLTLGATAPVYAQQEQRDQQEEQKARPAGQEEKKAQPEKPAKQEEKSTKQEEKTAQQQDKNAKQEEKNAQQQDKNAKQEEKSAQQQQHTQQAQRASDNGRGRIPDDRFKANFGEHHRFRVSQADYSNHRFQYGGYSFVFVDAWPSNWLYTQDVFVIEINGVYYLCNAMYPGINIALSFTP